MNNNLTAETKLEIINLITQSQTKQELKDLLQDYLTETQEKIPSLSIEEELPPVEESKTRPIQVETPSIYSQKYRELVDLDKQNHPRENIKLSSEVPEDSSNIKTTTPTIGLSEENPPKNEPTVLPRTPTHPRPASRARTVAPGELNLNWQ